LQVALMGNGPRLGNTESGLVAAATGTQFAIVSGAIGTIVGICIVAKVMPNFSHYRAPGEEIVMVAKP
jgi:uncharacterized membrane protein YuzA (DUF378 family)